MSWIRVSDQLPKDKKAHYLTYSPEIAGCQIRILPMNNRKFYSHVTHWMNLPKTPSMYKRIDESGLEVHNNGMDYVKREDLKKLLKKRGWTRLFGKYYGIQTSCMLGPYAHDVEAVLERIISGELKGSQLMMD